MRTKIAISLMGLLFGFSLSTSAQAGRGGLEIIEAWYGVGDRACDATYAVAAQCRGGDCEVYADNQLCGDPRRGREKSLFVSYACGGREQSTTIPEHAVGYLTCGSRHSRVDRPRFNRSPRARDRRSGIEILGASYGSQHRACDATGAAYEYCAGRGECAVPADNYLCGDPHRGVRKSLFVEYTCGGRAQRASAAEHGEAYLSCR